MIKIYFLNFHLEFSDSKISLKTKRFKVFFVCIYFLFFTPFILLAQETSVVFGVENLHISEKAKVIEVKEGTNKIYSNIHKHKKPIFRLGDRKSIKKIDKQVIKKIERKRSVQIAYHNNATSETSFTVNQRHPVLGLTDTCKHKTADYAVIRENLLFVFLFMKDEKQNALLLFNQLNQLKKSFFTRPPPFIYERLLNHSFF